MTLRKLIICIIGIISIYACNTPKETENLPIGVQLYSVRQDMANDFLGTLCKVKEMGYDGVEFAGLFDKEPAQIKHWCDSLELIPISAHVPLKEMLEDLNKVINDYKTIGCEYIVVPYVSGARRPDGELFYQTVDEIREIGKKAKDAGLILLYHNHDFEFRKLESGQTGLDYLYENVDADVLQTELDLCWVKYAGYDPVEYLKKYSGRAPIVHFKDFYMEGEKDGDPYALIGVDSKEKKSKTKFEYRPVGYGIQDVPALVEAAKAAGSKWFIVEQDQPSMGKTPLESIKLSIDYIKAL